MIDRQHELPITRQTELLNIRRGTVYYLPRSLADADLTLTRRIDELHLEHPFMGARMLRRHLLQEGIKVARRHVRTLMQRFGLRRRCARSRVRANATRGTRSTPTCCAASPSLGPIRSGQSIRRIAPWPGDSFI